MSFDSAASPSVTVKSHHDVIASGWGFGWYPNDDSAGVVIKNPRSARESVMTRVLRDWDKFRSSTFVCHIRGAAKRASQRDTLPFLGKYAGRHWILSHNGSLSRHLARELSLGEDPLFEPVGSTDSEHAFCWILKRLRERGARTLARAGWTNVHELFENLNRYGTANFLLTDGLDLVAYRDYKGAGGDLFYCRRRPPHANTTLENDVV
ncbi:MAG: class II glutamine amidotransferase, partial [Cyanobacteria bacterium]|nr:class II glutamine amidotransferase [Cyanobacteriota bacterium]